MERNNNEVFKEKCTVVNLRKEYSGTTPYTGIENYAIVTSLSEAELAYTFGEALVPYTPYIVLTPEMYNVITEGNKNDERERKRNTLYHNTFAIGDERVPVDSTSDPSSIIEDSYTEDRILEEMMKLPGKLGHRIYQRFFLGRSVTEIAKVEGVSSAAITKSLKRATTVIHKSLIESEVLV